MLIGFKYMRSEVLVAVNTIIPDFWDVTLCSSVARYQCFRGICCLHFQVEE
jgi:hypothetical protein